MTKKTINKGCFAVFLIIIGIMVSQCDGCSNKKYEPPKTPMPTPAPEPKPAPKPEPKPEPKPQPAPKPAPQPAPSVPQPEPSFDFPSEYLPVHRQLSTYFSEVANSFNEEGTIIALYPFTKSGDGAPRLLKYLTESAYFYLSKNSSIQILRRQVNENTGNANAKFLLRCNVNPIQDIILTIRVIDIGTGEIIDLFDYTLRNDNQIERMLEY
ncbi:MAG: hypothetical protein LBH85_06140 [Treponema sp.]|jgi:hypothetical protein|nr:hypothetical protein [Treponema sp.]